jgi:peptidylprolyl isomerase
MNIFKVLLMVTAIQISTTLYCSAEKSEIKPGVKVSIKTTEGNIVIRLFDETPLHQANFIKLVNEKFYDGTLFHRVIKDFMVQAGNPETKTAKAGQPFIDGGPDYTINPEFNPVFYHKKGALAAARTADDVNPEKKSSGSQFYIVLGKVYTEEELTKLEKQMNMTQIIPLMRDWVQLPENAPVLEKLQVLQQAGNEAGLDSMVNSIVSIIKKKHPEMKEIKYSDEQKRIYKTIGGTPFLDMNYTVFGEVLEGLDVVEKIGAAETDSNDRPKGDIRIISMEIIK